MLDIINTALPQLTRRAILGGLAGVTVAGTAAAARPSPVLPTREDLEDYFLFIRSEHKRIADELGIDMFDVMTFHQRGGHKRYELNCPTPASARALGVLAHVGMIGGAA